MEQILIQVNEKIGELKREVKYLRRTKICPFWGMFGNKIECVYKDQWHSCYRLETSPGNRDAWCAKQINKSLDGKFPTD